MLEELLEITEGHPNQCLCEACYLLWEEEAQIDKDYQSEILSGLIY